MSRRMAHTADFAVCVFLKNRDGSYTPCRCGRTYEQWQTWKAQKSS